MAVRGYDVLCLICLTHTAIRVTEPQKDITEMGLQKPCGGCGALITLRAVKTEQGES